MRAVIPTYYLAFLINNNYENRVVPYSEMVVDIPTANVRVVINYR